MSVFERQVGRATSPRFPSTLQGVGLRSNTLKRGHRTAALRFTALVVVQIWRSRLPNRITNHETPMNTDIQMPKPPISPTAPRSIFGLWISFVICHSTGPWSHCTLSKSPCIHKLSASERGVDAASLSLLPQLSLNSNLVGSFTLKRPEGRAPTNRQLLDAPIPIPKPQFLQ